MTRFRTQLKKNGMQSLLAALVLTATLLPTSALSAERDGTVLFFSFEELRQELAKPSLPQIMPAFTWNTRPEDSRQLSPIERSYWWGNGLGIDGYAHPGARQPLWGY